jgi:hypothetical protein
VTNDDGDDDDDDGDDKVCEWRKIEVVFSRSVGKFRMTFL